MLSFFRNFTKSRVGLIVVFVVLALIAIAFAAGDVTGIRGNNAGGSGGTIARVGSARITDAEVRARIDRFLREARARGQNVTMEQFLAQGGLDLVINELTQASALEQFAQKMGMRASRKLIDSDIVNASVFQDVAGKFDQKKFDAWLGEQRMSRATLTEEAMRDRYGAWLGFPAATSRQQPLGVVAPYASLQLERRSGIVGMVPTFAMDPGPDPDDKTLTAFYTSHRAAYSVPERRIVRYASVNQDAMRTANAATEAEISAAYAKAGARFAATEKRGARQLILPDQAAANKVAADLRAGKAIAAVASDAGLEPITFDAVDKAALARQTTPAVADAAFAAAQGAVVGPIKGPIGWHVLQVDKIDRIAARSLAQAHDELAKEIGARKLATALTDLRQKIDDGIGDGKTFDEAVRDAGLTAQTTPALTAQGLNPDDTAYQPDPALMPIVQAGFGIGEAGGEPQLVATSQDGAFAVVTLSKVVPAAPRPLAQIRDRVLGDYRVDQALQKARAVANQVVAKVNKGTPMAQALSEAGIAKGPPPKPFDFKRSELQGKEDFIQMAFAMAPKKAKLSPAPDRKGFYIVYVDAIEEHDASKDPVMLENARAAFSRSAGGEIALQFFRAVQQEMKVTRNEDAIARLRDDLARSGGAGN